MASTVHTVRPRDLSWSLLTLLLAAVLILIAGSDNVAAADPLGDTTVADFQAGTVGTDLYVGQGGNGELLLAPTVATEFAGSAFPSGWSQTAWTAGGAATVANGSLAVDGTRANTDALFGPGSVLEFVATFSTDPFQHVGLGADFNDAPWAMFSTGGGGLSVGL